MNQITSEQTKVDIMLLLEGSYPYVSGGVASWVEQIIKSLPQFHFGVVFLGGRKEDYEKPHYELPANVTYFSAHYLFEEEVPVKAKPAKDFSKENYQNLEGLHCWFREQKEEMPFNQCLTPEFLLDPKRGVTYQQFLTSKRAWDFLVAHYKKYCPELPFSDYFWTLRAIHKPIWELAEIAEKLPQAKVYHSISTGYAGFLAVMLKNKHPCQFILTEHGLYTKERKIDLMQNEWIKGYKNRLLNSATDIGYLNELWMRFFQSISLLCYQKADKVISLFDKYQAYQIAAGADQAKTEIIANGVSIQRMAAIREMRQGEQADSETKVIALIGRVVPIKDIKTFIRAVKLVVGQKEGVEAWVVGAQDESKGYVQECYDFVNQLGLEKKVKFLGKKDLAEVFPKIKLVVLSSISEGLPLVVLEGMAAGVPIVCTDVGACRQLIYGASEEDKALGASGAVVEIANPEALAAKILHFLTHQKDWLSAQQAGIHRVEKFYDIKDMFSRYQTIYEQALNYGGNRV